MRLKDINRYGLSNLKKTNGLKSVRGSGLKILS